jgi:hypothetical protein
MEAKYPLSIRHATSPYLQDPSLQLVSPVPLARPKPIEPTSAQRKQIDPNPVMMKANPHLRGRRQASDLSL